MSSYLDKTGLTYLWGKIKARIPTKTSDLTNDSGFLTSHQDISGKLDKSGGTMTGALTLSGAPTANLHAVTKKYVDDGLSGVSGVEYEIVTSLPTTGAEDTVYLISTNFDPSTYTPVTYTLSRSNDTITLTGSNSTTTSVNGGLTTSEVENLIDTTINDVLGVRY